MKYPKYFLLAPFVSILLITTISCDKDPVLPNEEELITTLTYTLTPFGGGTPIVFSFRDIDGDGGQAPVIITAPLNSSTSYNGSVQLLNESVSPVKNISDEIEEEADEHQLFFIDSNVDVGFTYSDFDGQGFPLGLNTVLTTSTIGQGTLTIVLRHLPLKSASGVSTGNLSNAGGETDIEVTFPLVIQ